jgi:2-polyprenyl-3-methyl-5-hydroxy-6-metoxy-1,4-benzoquinol methylase
MNSEIIKEFYSKIKFPGAYSIDDIKFYEIEGIHNIYLREIDQNLDHNLEILDVGCGTGLVSNLFAYRYKSNFTAIDFSDSIHFAQKFSQENCISNTSWIKEDFLNFETEKKFDIIICCGVLHHIPEYQSALNKIKHMLKPGGKLLLGLYNPWGKILKKYFRIKYHNDILYQDQENNPYELSFNFRQVLAMCNDLKFCAVVPSYKNRFVNLLSFLNSENGGLALYVFEKSNEKNNSFS